MTRADSAAQTPVAEGQDPERSVGSKGKTARNSRRLLKTGTVAEYRDLLPQAPTGALANEALINVEAATTAPALIPRRVYPQIADKDVVTARTMIVESGVVEFLTDLVEAGKSNRGPKARVTVEALLVAMWLAAQTGRPSLLTEFSDILFHCISRRMRRLLKVSDGRTPRSAIPSRHRRWNKTAAKALGETFNQMTAVIDPSDEVTRRKQVNWDDMKFRGLTDEEMSRLQAWLDFVSTCIVHVTYTAMPESVQAHDVGDRCIDGTGVPMFTRSRGLDHPQAMSMPHAGNLVREGDHGEPNENEPPQAAKPSKGKAKGDDKPKRKVTFYPALELHILTASDTTPGDDQYFPNGLVTAMTTDRPSLDPAGSARRLFALEKHFGNPTGYVTGDGLYAKAAADSFQSPARRERYKVLLPILPSASGVQGAHPSGAPMVDGTYTCPAMPAHLQTAVADLRERRITLKTFGERIRARKKYELVTKQNADEHGIGERIGCRAANHSLTVKCGEKQDSLKPRLTLDRDGNLADTRPEIDLPSSALTHGQPPTICKAQTITLKPTDGAKFRQAQPIGDEHTDIYNRLRQPHEGANGFAKDEAKEALALAGRRRVRTKVAQQLFMAFLLAAANMRRIRSFMERAQIDEHGHYYVARTKRKGSHARTGLPPGTPLNFKPLLEEPASDDEASGTE